MNKILLLVICSIIHLGGCASAPKLSQDKVLEQYQDVAKLGESLKQASENGWQLLSPLHFNYAEEAYKQALKQGASQNSAANSTAEKGLASLVDAEALVDVARYELQGVLAARKKAKAAGAVTEMGNAFTEVDTELKKLAILLEEGKKAKARGGRGEVEAQYAELELQALKRDTLADAEKLIKTAKKDDIDDLAPKTIAMAEQELELAKTVIETDRDAKEKAQQHARMAIWNVQRATQIVELLKEFKQSAMTAEDQVLWYQKQLAASVSPFVSDPDFSQKNSLLVKSVTQNLKQKSFLLDEMQIELERMKSQYDRTMGDKEKNLAEIRARAEEDRRQNALLEGKFKQIQQSFTEDEAEVYRQGNNVLIRTYGFTFPSGSSEIQATNYPLLKKIVTSIELFPASSVEVSGHTDNRGSDAVNESLSKDRAAKVGSFLINVGQLGTSRVTSIGYGKRKPIASNDTQEGRASNRRVEILIKNPQLLP